MTNDPIITISREYGSGGHEVGKRLAEVLGIPFFDNELIAIAAKDSGYSEQVFANAEQTATSTFSFALSMVGTGGVYGMPLNNQLYQIQSSIIRTIADRGSAVVVGRCADYVLKDYAPCLNIFVQADLESRIETVMTRDHLMRNQAEKRISKMDKSRATYYNFYSDQTWGNRKNYDIVINSSIGVDETVDILSHYIRIKLGNGLRTPEKSKDD